jgi:hypothetical protein
MTIDLQEAMKLLEKNILSEVTTADAASTETRLKLLTKIFQKSIATQVCSVQPTAMPDGKAFATKRNGTGGLGTKFVDFTVGDEANSKPVGRFNKEWMQDFIAYFGIDGQAHLTKTVLWDAIESMDRALINGLHSIAQVYPTLTLAAAADPRVEFIKIIGAANKATANISKESENGFNPYWIVSPKVAAAISTLGIGQSQFDQNEEMLNKEYIGKYGNVDVFVDIKATTEFVLVGHKDDGAGDSTYILCPYKTYDMVMDDYSLEESAIVVFNRYALVRSPWDNTGVNDSIMAKKIPVDFTALTTF